MDKREYTNHYEEKIFIRANPKSVFAYSDDHRNFSSHMNQSSWMMGGGKMETSTDEGEGQRVGSHIRMGGKVFGVHLYLDEVITQHDPPNLKVWETVGKLNLLVIDHYRLGFEITPDENGSQLKVFIDYDMPRSSKTRWLGMLFGDMYAKWCVKQMIQGVKKHFS